MSQNNQPIAQFKLGLVKALVWANETAGGTRHNVTFVRIYRKDDEWRETTSFGRDDLPLLAKVADQAHTWIFQQSSSES